MDVSNGARYFYSAGSTSYPSGQLPVGLSSTDPAAVDDGCTPYPAGFFSGKAALIRRGGCNFSVKAQNALDAGAVVLIIYNNAPGLINPVRRVLVGSRGDMLSLPSSAQSIGTVKIPLLALSDRDGADLINIVKANPAVTISLPIGYVNVPNTATGGLVSTFTTYGPSFDSYIKPSIAAPGGNILR